MNNLLTHIFGLALLISEPRQHQISFVCRQLYNHWQLFVQFWLFFYFLYHLVDWEFHYAFAKDSLKVFEINFEDLSQPFLDYFWWWIFIIHKSFFNEKFDQFLCFNTQILFLVDFKPPTFYDVELILKIRNIILKLIFSLFIILFFANFVCLIMRFRFLKFFITFNFYLI